MNRCETTIFEFAPQSLSDTPTLSAILDKQAADPVVSQRIFSVFPDVSQSYVELTYRDFASLVDATANQWYETLSSLSGPVDAEHGHPVIAVLSDTGLNLAVTIMAVLKLNATIFLLSPANSEPALAHLLKSCDVSAFLYDTTYAAACVGAAATCSVKSFPLEKPSYEHQRQMIDVYSRSSRQPRYLHPTPPDIPIILHSSGSTSFPKPVLWSNTSFLANSQVHYTSGGWSAFTEPENRFLCLGPLFHSMGITLGLGGTICAGSTVVFPLAKSWPPSPLDVVNSLRLAGVTTCVMVPSLLEQVASCLRDLVEGAVNHLEILTKLQVLLVGGAHCPDHLANYLVSHGVNMKYVYGSTEAGHMMVGSHERARADDTSSWKLLRPMPHSSLIFKPVINEDPTDTRSLCEVHMHPDDPRLAPRVLKGRETWNTGDVVEESPHGSGWYKLLFREDDILVHDSGEKTNPIPMEESCRSCEIIDRMVVVGHRRPLNAAIIQLNAEKAAVYTEDARTKICRDAIRVANAEAPKHSRIIDEMILILPIGYSKRIPVTNKGNIIRPKVVEVFKEELEGLYGQFSEGKSSSNLAILDPSLTHSMVQERIKAILGDLLEDKQYGVEDNLFNVGLDSVNAIALRNRLSRDFDLTLSQNFVYQNFSVSQLTSAIGKRIGSHHRNADASPSVQERENVLQTLLERQFLILRHSAPLILASQEVTRSMMAPASKTVAVVGATGSLGIWQVANLLDSPDVAKIVCFARGSNVQVVYDKLLDALARVELLELVAQMKQWREAQLAQPGKLALDLDQRLVVVPFDLSKPEIDAKEYISLARGLTTIIHTGWKMDFNQVAQSFEDCLEGTTQLLLLAGFMRPKVFYFISSIGTVMESDMKPVPETFVPWVKQDALPVSPHGYSESKFVAEHVVEAAASMLKISCAISRIGQITGDTASGFWKAQEMNPIMIAGSLRIGKFPSASMLVDWVPVDTVAASTVELALKAHQQAPSSDTLIHHIVSPVPITYMDIMHHLQSLGYSLVPVSPSDWWAAIMADDGNPCHSVEAYIQESFIDQPQGSFTEDLKPILDVTKTLQVSEHLRKCPPLDRHLWSKYIQQWKKQGLIQ